jgi:hypothetical protein
MHKNKGKFSELVSRNTQFVKAMSSKQNIILDSIESEIFTGEVFISSLNNSESLTDISFDTSYNNSFDTSFGSLNSLRSSNLWSKSDLSLSPLTLQNNDSFTAKNFGSLQLETFERSSALQNASCINFNNVKLQLELPTECDESESIISPKAEIDFRSKVAEKLERISKSLGKIKKRGKNSEISLDDLGLDYLPQDSYKEIAICTANYSTHLGSKLFNYDPRTGNFLYKELKAGDRSKDVEDDMVVSNNHILLTSSLVSGAMKCALPGADGKVVLVEDKKAFFSSYASLLHSLSTLIPSNCNQDNAMVFAKELEKFNPSLNEKYCDKYSQKKSNSKIGKGKG